MKIANTQMIDKKRFFNDNLHNPKKLVNHLMIELKDSISQHEVDEALKIYKTNDF
jgi:hypothetical protein